MLNCKETTQLVSESMDHQLTFRRRMGLKMHLLMCRYCDRYSHQIAILRNLVRRYSRDEIELENGITLPPESSDRLTAALNARMHDTH